MLIIDWLSSLRSHSCAQAAGAIARIATQVDRKRRRMVNLRWLSADRTIPAHLESRNAGPSGWRIFDEPRDLWRPRCARLGIRVNGHLFAGFRGGSLGSSLRIFGAA